MNSATPSKVDTPLLSVQNLRVQFRIHDSLVDIIRGVSFDIDRGETVALVGESGSGKSVIARTIMGILPDIADPFNGRILFSERPGEQIDLLALHPDGAEMRGHRGGNISMIFQEPMVSLSPLHTVGDQVSEALHLHRQMSAKEGKKTCLEMLELVGFHDPQRTFKAYPFELSGGMRQRAMIAMALICHPALLIADEPTTALDVTIQAQILKLIRELQKKMDMAVLMITHDLGVVANVADRVVVVYRGDVMESGSAEQIFNAPGHEYTRALLRAVPRIDVGKQPRLTPVREVHAEVGEFLQRRQKNQATSSQGTSKNILEIHQLRKTFGARASAWSLNQTAPPVVAVDDVSLTIKRGECLGLVGESGSGKSTLGKLVARAMSPDSGSILFHDRSQSLKVEELEEEALFEYRCRVQYMFQDPVGSLNPSMTVFDILREPMVIHNLGGQDYQVEMCKELMRLVGLDPRYLRRYPHSFSGGQRQRIGIARALALQPDLLICDEPVSALDVSIQAQVLNLMRDLQQELGLSYLFISHNLAVVDYISDRVAVMYRGKLVEVAPSENLFDQAVHPYTQSLLKAVPVADLARPLAFDELADTQDEQNWPEQFSVAAHVSSAMLETAPEHFVRQQIDTSAR
ncbi:MAG: ABC transporter ATP-binding protein [Acidiferrobacterales bacterium]|nr:ABC transporter ATP-binding protein [Acidiferrobacterales bacterium]